jgi:predicted phosphodiesterase
MASANPHGRKLIHDLLAKFPDSSSRQIARMAYKDSPKLFTDVEAARCLVRYARGAMGKEHRHKATHEPTKHTVAGMPKSIPTFKDWKPYQMGGAGRTLIISDVHCPFHDEDALDKAIQHGKKEGADRLLINGDLADQHAVSHWETNPEERDFGEEIELTIQMLKWLRSEFPKGEIVWKKGNHEERYEKYMQRKAPELLGVKAFKFDEIYNVSEVGITVVGECRPVHVGKLPVLHGHEYKFAISNPVNPARGLWTRAKESAVCAHFHQLSSHSETSLSGHEFTTYSTGCLCQLRYRYNPLSNTRHGFAIATTEKDGAWSMDNLKVKRKGLGKMEVYH